MTSCYETTTPIRRLMYRYSWCHFVLHFVTCVRSSSTTQQAHAQGFAPLESARVPPHFAAGHDSDCAVLLTLRPKPNSACLLHTFSMAAGKRQRQHQRPRGACLLIRSPSSWQA